MDVTQHIHNTQTALHSTLFGLSQAEWESLTNDYMSNQTTVLFVTPHDLFPNECEKIRQMKQVNFFDASKLTHEEFFDKHKLDRLVTVTTKHKMTSQSR